jgi:hypothetical protein
MTARPTPPNKATVEIIAKWMGRLKSRCIPPADGTAKAMADRVTEYVGELALAFPSGAFTDDSLRYVVADQTWFPPLSLVQQRLGEWWAQHKPACAPASHSTASRPIGWESLDQQWLDWYHQKLPDAAALEEQIGVHRLMRMDPPQRPIAHLESLIRRQSPRAWAVISGDTPITRSVPSSAEISRVAAVLAAPVPQQPAGVLESVSGPRTPESSSDLEEHG